MRSSMAAVEVDGGDGGKGRGGGVAGDLADGVWGEIEGEGVDIGEDGAGAGAEDRAGGSEEAEGRRDDGAAWLCLAGGVADACGGQREPEGVGSAGAADGVGDMAGLGGGGFKGGDLGAEDEALRGADGLDGGHELVAQLGKLSREVEHRHGLRGSFGGNRGHLCMVQGRVEWIGDGIEGWRVVDRNLNLVGRARMVEVSGFVLRLRH